MTINRGSCYASDAAKSSGNKELTRYFDHQNHRLVYINSLATSQFWDDHWQTNNFEKAVKNNHNPFIIKNTQRYLSTGSRILEGGCGRGDKVYSLQNHGFDAYGVDFAPEVIEKINNVVPELQVTLGDVRKLEFSSNFFDGYWSLGVIEHFFNGYEDIASEMNRVLRPGGILFLTAPGLSPIRKLRHALDYTLTFLIVTKIIFINLH